MSEAPVDLTVYRNARMRDATDQAVRYVLDVAGDGIVGMAFIVWGADGASTVAVRVSDGSRIPTILVPEFVKLRLLAEKIEHWTIEAIEARA